MAQERKRRLLCVVLGQRERKLRVMFNKLVERRALLKLRACVMLCSEAQLAQLSLPVLC